MKRILSLFLCIVMTISFVLVSCEKEEVKEQEENNSTVAGGSEDDIFAERAAVDDELEDKDYGGRKFRIVSHRTDEYWIEEDLRNKGDLIADAKYARNKTVENRFNVEIEVAYQSIYSDVNSWVAKTVMSGADEFDLFCSHSAYAGGVVVKNVFLNWYDIPNVDFTKPWWSRYNSERLTYDDKCILAVSDFNYLAYANSFCIYFNKNLAAAYDMGNLYDVVLDGKWTVDYFLELAGDIYQDNDGDGERSNGDFYGFFIPTYSSAVGVWLYAFDNPTIGFDEEGMPVIQIRTDKINNIVQKTYDMIFNTGGILYDIDKDIVGDASMFLEKKSIFYEAILAQATGEGLRNFDDEYGLLPLPKWDENQKGYYTAVSGEHTILAVPKTVQDTEFVGTIIEALSAESYKQVIPTFYEIALKTRYLRDSESKEVLDYIVNGIVLDFDKVYLSGEGFCYTIDELIRNKSSNFESYYTKKYKKANSMLKKVVKSFDKLDG